MSKMARSIKGSDDRNTLVWKASAKISFILYSEAGVDCLSGCPFRIEGCGLEIQGNTDEKGQFEDFPVPYGDYNLFVYSGEFVIPSIPEHESPHPVHLPCELIPEIDEWMGGLVEAEDGEQINAEDLAEVDEQIGADDLVKSASAGGTN